MERHPPGRMRWVGKTLACAVFLAGTTFAGPTHWKRIHGHVVHADGTPAVGVHVRLYDSDWPSSDDLMGESWTNGNGDYVIDFLKAEWDDGKLLGITSWRPDVYLRLAWNGLDQRTPIESDVPMRNMRRDDGGKRIDAVLQATDADTGFRPSFHGFHFGNVFQASIFGVDVLQFGLCGGMVRYALDRFQEGSVITNAGAPPRGGWLFDQLQDLQRACLPGGWFQIAEWQAWPTEDHKVLGVTLVRGLGSRTRSQWSTLKANLDLGHPTVLTVIRNGPLAWSAGLGNFQLLEVWKNDQVLATRYELLPGQGVRVWIYDPDYPLQNEVTLEFDLADTDRNNLHMVQYQRDAMGSIVRTENARAFYCQFAYPVAANPPTFPPIESAALPGHVPGSNTWMGDFDGNHLVDRVHFVEAAPKIRLGFNDGSSLGAIHVEEVYAFHSGQAITTVGKYFHPDRDALIVYDRVDHAWRAVAFTPSSGLRPIELGDTRSFWHLDRGHQFVTGDFDGDGLDELMFHFPDDRHWWLGEFDGPGMRWRLVADTANAPPFDDARLRVADLDGDGRDDVLIHLPTQGLWLAARLDPSNQVQLSTLGSQATGFESFDSDELWVLADVDGDQADEIVVQRRDGTWHVGDVTQGTQYWTQVSLGAPLGALATEDTEVLVGDYDADGRQELMLYLHEEMEWWLLDIAVAQATTLTRVARTPEFSELFPEPKLLTGRYLSATRDAVGFLDTDRGVASFARLEGGALVWQRMLATVAGRATRYAPPCGRPGFLSQLVVTGEPVRDSHYRFSLDAGGSIALLLVGLQRATIPLASCTMDLLPLIVLPFDPTGAALRIEVPNDGSWTGASVFIQIVTDDPLFAGGLRITDAWQIDYGDAFPYDPPYVATLLDRASGSTTTTTSPVVDLELGPRFPARTVRAYQISNDFGHTWSPWTTYPGGRVAMDLRAYGGHAAPGLHTATIRVRDDRGDTHGIEGQTTLQ